MERNHRSRSTEISGHVAPKYPVRQDAEAKALQCVLQHGEQQLAQGKVRPVAEVVKRLRRVK